MPQKFDNCVAGGGQIRTKRLSSQHYIHICIPKGGGSSVSGEIKTYKKLIKGSFKKGGTVKSTGAYMLHKGEHVIPVGQGGRFQMLKNKLAHRKGITNPGALAAFIGRKKYGQKRMTAMSVAGRKNA